jgi:hypothetical protein
MTNETLIVRLADNEYTVVKGQSFTFGRAGSCSVCLDSDDTSISRRAGSVDWEHSVWWLTNSSNTRPLDIVDDIGMLSVLAPGRRIALEGRMRVIVTGMNRNHELITEAQTSTNTADAQPATGLPTVNGNGVSISETDRYTLVALFASYLLEIPGQRPEPRNYDAAAKRLGVPRTTVVKRIEHLRNRLDAAGVPDMRGPYAMSNLAKYVLTARIITKADLRLIGL